ncbi:MAG: methionyl-tRNA formyltransferase [Proteobacteria bacterium]|nr:methionyl-tRNA formyltransferase [Pseudomonadota bacterium]
MKLIFMGSPEEVIKPLEHIVQHCQKGQDKLLGVISQPARPAGRKNILTDPPVARFAKTCGLPIWQPEKASSAEFLAVLRAEAPDVLITAAYGQILSEALLQIPIRATINIHPSMLPAYRGATPVPAALLDGLSMTGVSILFTVKALDAGHIIIQKTFPIGPEETSGILTSRLFAASGPLLLEALDLLRDPGFVGTPQNPSQVSMCRKISKIDGQINWQQSADQLVNQFRAYHPWPGSFCLWREQRILVESLIRAESTSPQLDPGVFILDRKHKSILVGTSSHPVWISQLKPAGSKSLDALSFWNGCKLTQEGRFT